MSTFIWLFLGHLIGDWLFQNDWMAKNKQNSFVTLPGMAHFAIYTLCIVATVLFFIDHQMTALEFWAFAAIVFGTHWLIDALNLAFHWGRLVQQSDLLLVRIVVDQTFHLLVLALLIHAYL